MLVLPIKRKSGLVIFQFLNFWPHFSFMWKCYWSITACWTHINSGKCAESNHTQLNWLGRVHRAFDIWGQMFKSESWRSWHVSDRKELTRYTAPTISHTVLTDLSPFQYIIHRIRRRACLFISLFLNHGFVMGQGDGSLCYLSSREVSYSKSGPLLCSNEPPVLISNMLLLIFLAWVSAIGQPFCN